MAKKCSTCKKRLPTPAFTRCKSNKDGLAWRFRDCIRSNAKRYNATAKGREANRNTQMKKKYGFTLEQYDALVVQQDGLCAICHSPETAQNQYGRQRLSIDHNHDTGKVRGLLCDKCNRGVGCFCDDPKILAEAIRYLL